MSRFVADYGGIGKMLRGEGQAVGLRTDLAQRGRRVLAAARRGSAKDTGEYKNSWQIAHNDHGGPNKDRYEVQVFNDDAAAVFNEYGNGHNTPPHTLLKALAAAGDTTAT